MCVVKLRLLNEYKAATLRLSQAVEAYSVAAETALSDTPKQLAIAALDAAQAARRALESHHCEHGCHANMPAASMHIAASPGPQDEIILTGSVGNQRVIARLSIKDLEQHFNRNSMSADEAKRLITVNLETIWRAVAISYQRHAYHPDVLSGRPVACVHLSIAGIALVTGEELSDSFFARASGSP